MDLWLKYSSSNTAKNVENDNYPQRSTSPCFPVFFSGGTWLKENVQLSVSTFSLAQKSGPYHDSNPPDPILSLLMLTNTLGQVGVVGQLVEKR